MKQKKIRELETKVKEFKNIKKEGIGLLALSATLLAPILIKSYLGGPETNELNDPWNTYLFIGGWTFMLSFVFGLNAYFHGKSYSEIYSEKIQKEREKKVANRQKYL